MKIERGINLPAKHKKKRGVYKDLALKMKVGDSVLCQGWTQAFSMARAIKMLGMKAATRTEKSGGIRVWRLK